MSYTRKENGLYEKRPKHQMIVQKKKARYFENM